MNAVGRIVGAFGLKGELKVDPLTDFVERMHKGSRLRLKDDWVTVESFRIHKGRPLLKLSGIDDVDAAQALQWQELFSAEKATPNLEEDEFLTEDLIGMMVVTTEGQEIGLVDDVLVTPAHDVLVIGPVMIPAVKEFVKQVDLDDDRITVQVIPGMLDDLKPAS
ncbi:MAG: ribosome maturation factor RimM [Fimbriimonas sp.]